MNRILITAAAVGLLTATSAFADVPGRDWISSAKVTQMLADQGFKVIKIEADDGHWEGEALRDRKKYDFHADPHSGRITRLERDRD